jgi:hypothetical protein
LALACILKAVGATMSEIRDVMTTEDEYDASAPALSQSVINLGASLPSEEWDRVPTDLAANLDHYLYGRPGEED